MNAPMNDRYERRFADPRVRPSNQRQDGFAVVTRQLGRFVDELEVERDGAAVREAWRILHPARPCPRAGGSGE